MGVYVSWVLSLDDFEGEVLEFGDQGAEFLRVVEQRLVIGQLFAVSRRVMVLPPILRVHSA